MNINSEQSASLNPSSFILHPCHIAVPVCARRVAELHDAMSRAAQVADFVELRLDCLDDVELDAAMRAATELLHSVTGPLILTLRPAEQGGRRVIDVVARLAFWLKFFSSEPPGNIFADIEHDLLPLLQERAGAADLNIDWSRVICSQHDFTGVPANLEQLYEEMAAGPARILKIAVQANAITDCLAVFRLLERARHEGRELIAVAMGEAGITTRILGPSRGTSLTFGALDETQATAPGQLAAADLRELYRLDSISERTAITGLLGWPVAHSLSPHMHNAAFAARKLDAVYLPLAVNGAREFMRRMVHPRTRELRWDLRGLSVTAPHKSAIMESLDSIDEAAREIGAVNTVVVEGDELCGYNTDAAAALVPLENLIDLNGARVAVIGAGGAARAMLWGLRERGAKTTIFARRTATAQEIAEQFAAPVQTLEGARFDEFDLVVNTTPLGTRGQLETETPATAAQLCGARIAYDLVYNPSETRFMREAHEAGCESVLNGLPMLVAQAATQFQLWTGEEAPLEVMRAAAERRIAEKR